MKLNIKRFAILSVVSLGLVLPACKDFLDQKPQGTEVTQDFFSTPEGALQATNAIYWQLRQYQTSTFAFVGIANITSDDADKGSVPGDAPVQQQLDDFTFDATNFLFNDYWLGQYAGVNKCNEVIVRVPAIQMDTILKTRYIGEAKFLRAYFYFNLVRTFGGVPKIVDIPTLDTPPTPRATAQEIYQLIQQDLQDAIATLPASYPESDIGRATSGAARGLLAKVNMYLGNWPQVLQLTNEVIASGQYNLSTPYESIWHQEGENSPESLFEIQAGLSQGCTPSSIMLGSQYSQVQAVRPALGWGFNTPSSNLLAEYEPGDPREAATILFRGETLSDGYVCDPASTNPQYNEKAYVRRTTPPSPCGQGDDSKNIRILRYADIVLMNAEANNQLGNGPQAAVAVNMVRARARGGNPNVLPDVTYLNQQQMQQAIWHERRVELAMENDRFWDLVRQGRAGQVLRALGKPFVDGKHELMPIPQTQIDATGGVLTQNPGY